MSLDLLLLIPIRFVLAQFLRQLIPLESLVQIFPVSLAHIFVGLSTTIGFGLVILVRGLFCLETSQV